MNDEYLEKILPFLKNIDEERQAQFKEYFESVPVWLLDSLCMEKVGKGETFIREGETVERIYFVCDGLIKATDYRIYGISFDFMLFKKVYAFGGMEVIMGYDKYLTSLQAVTDCTMLTIPRADFKKWMDNDAKTLKHEAKLIAEYLLEQSRNIRAFLFLQGSDRLMLLLKHRYEKYSEKGVLTLNSDRRELSDYTGLSTKTITRAIKTLKAGGILAERRGLLIVTEEQYQMIRDKLAKILADDIEM